MAQILQQVPNNYETDLIFPIVQCAAAIAGIDYAQADDATKVALKVIGDHVRAVVHMLADGITASNEGRGYVLRRLIRRVIRYGRLIGIEKEFTPLVAETAIALSESHYPNVRLRERSIKVSLQREEVSFLKTLDRGETLLADLIEQLGPGGKISGSDAFKLYDTYGFPLELTEEIAAEKNLTIDTAGLHGRAWKPNADDRKPPTKRSTSPPREPSISWPNISSKQEFIGYRPILRPSRGAGVDGAGSSRPSRPSRNCGADCDCRQNPVLCRIRRSDGRSGLPLRRRSAGADRRREEGFGLFRPPRPSRARHIARRRFRHRPDRSRLPSPRPSPTTPPPTCCNPPSKSWWTTT